MRYTFEIQAKIDAILSELRAADAMSEAEVCELYNVDSREESRYFINEGLSDLRDEYEQAIYWENEQIRETGQSFMRAYFGN